MISLRGKVALVTGAASGIGAAIALWLGKAGADVAVTDIVYKNDHDVLSPTSRFANSESRNCALRLDVSDPEQVASVVSRIEDTLGSVDILVNNAGIMGNFNFIEKQTESVWDKTLAVNLSGAFHCSKAVWQAMRKKEWGRIINIASIVGKMGAFAQPAYGASKAGLEGLTRSLALEGARFHITANAVLPGLIDTEGVRTLVGDEILALAPANIPMQRLGTVDDIAQTVVFLASDMSEYITGASIPVTGGIDLLKV